MSNQRDSRRKSLIVATLAVVAVAAIASASAFLNRAGHSLGRRPRSTQVIARGDLVISVTEHGTLRSSNNTEIKNKVRGENTVIFVVENGTKVKKGDILLKLDTLMIEEQIDERTKFSHMARSAAERSKASMEAARLAIEQYKQGRFRAELMTLEKDLAIARSRLTSAQNILDHTKMKASSGYSSNIQVQERQFALKRAQNAVDLKQSEIHVLKKFQRQEEIATLEGNFRAVEAKYYADKERAYADEHRRLRAVEELKHCVVTAPRDGIVIHPSAAAWKDAPEVSEGGTVHKNQTLLLMPDLSKMEVKVGIHESMVQRVSANLKATIRLPGRVLEGHVASVAPVTAPAGWWTGNVVKYDTVVQLPNVPDLKPGMSAEVEIIMAEHRDVLLVPVSAVIEAGDEYLCWVEGVGGPERRTLRIGDSSDLFIVVDTGLKEGDTVIINPLAHIQEAQDLAARTLKRQSPLGSRNAPPTSIPSPESKGVSDDGD